MTMIIGISALLLMSFMIYLAGLSLAKNHPRDLNIVWYFFSLALTATALLGIIAVEIGAVDSVGKFHGRVGLIIKFLLNFFLDLKLDILIAATLLGLVLIPQILCFILSGFFGCANQLFFIEGSLSFFIWFVVKSFATAAGIGISFVCVAILNKWPNTDWIIGLALIVICLSLLFFSFNFLGFYRDSNFFINKIKEKSPAILVNTLRLAHVFLTRNTNNKLKEKHSHQGQ